VNCHTPPIIHSPPPRRPRNLPLERQITDMAAKAVDASWDGGPLSDYAHERAAPFGGVRTNLDWRREVKEELADARNYICWGLEEVWEAYEAGDVLAGEQVVHGLTALSGVLRAWDALQRW
jgi:hypothetical protein